MKNTVKTILCLGLCALPFSIQAGEFVDTDSKQAIEQSPQNDYFVSLGAQHLDKIDSELYTLALGKRFAINDSLSYDLFLETGYSAFNHTNFVPITFNSSLIYTFDSGLSAFIGAGAGASYTDWMSSGDSWRLTARAFAGLSYPITDRLEAFVKVDTYWVDDHHNSWSSDDFSYGGGLTWKF
jgi:opacity protein-like surface antigen